MSGLMANTHDTGPVWIEGLDAYLRGDCDTTLKLLKPLAASGNIEAQNLIGHIYLYGKCVKRDLGEAEKWLKLAADRGLPVAQASLDDMARDGLCKPNSEI